MAGLLSLEPEDCQPRPPHASSHMIHIHAWSVAQGYGVLRGSVLDVVLISPHTFHVEMLGVTVTPATRLFVRHFPGVSAFSIYTSLKSHQFSAALLWQMSDFISLCLHHAGCIFIPQCAPPCHQMPPPHPHPEHTKRKREMCSVHPKPVCDNAHWFDALPKDQLPGEVLCRGEGCARVLERDGSIVHGFQSEERDRVLVVYYFYLQLSLGRWNRNWCKGKMRIHV